MRRQSVEFERQRIVCIESPCDSDQVLREVGIDAPVAHRVGIGQGVAGNLLRKPRW